MPLVPFTSLSTTDEDYSIFEYTLYSTFDYRPECFRIGADVDVLLPVLFRE
ncbi:MAG: hypothetical protein RSA50_08035 [Mucinivorans sp.]